LLYIMTNQHVNELAIYGLHKLKDFAGSNQTCKCCFLKLSEYQKYCRFKFFTSNWVYCKNSLNILQAYPKSFHFSYFKEFSCQKMRCANSILKQAQTMIIKTFWCSLEQHDDILRFEKLKPEHGKIIQSSKA